MGPLGRVCLLLGAGMAAVACDAASPGVSAVRSQDAITTESTTAVVDTTVSATTVAPTTSTTEPLPVQLIDFGSTKAPRSYDSYLSAVFTDVARFWNEEYPLTYGTSYTPLSGGVFAAYAARQEPIPGCGTPQTVYDDVQGNAFYCISADFVVYDDDQLLPQLVDSLGQSGVGVVLAHEFGHSIQARAGEWDHPTVLKEQQADCFAGAWAAHVARGEAPGLTFTDKDIKTGLMALIKFRDPVQGDSLADPGAHGSGFDRVGAFEDGYIGGPLRCKTIFTENREATLIDIPFDPTDTNSGNLPVVDPVNHGDIVTLVPQDLNRYWTAVVATVSPNPFTPPSLVTYPQTGPFPPCASAGNDVFFAGNILYCPDTNQILVDQDLAVGLDTPGISDEPQFGDLSVGYLIGVSYAESVQSALGSTLGGKQRQLVDDCLVGSWLSDDIPPLSAERQQDPLAISLSAGDLDEAVLVALQVSDETADENVAGTAFEKIAAFREGVLAGVSTCLSHIR
ncbi:MAG: hypothetical protein QOE09_2294 [Ilumatobacteraceae bacterium]